MNEGAKTGIYWAAAVAMLAVAITVAWPPRTDSDTESLIGQPLFASFTDPLTAASLRIVSFEDARGELGRFEVAKDDTTGVWSIPSRNNYPADALEQMQKAANALIDLKVLDIQTENAEDHADLGVVEPKADAAEFGAEGVGRLVTFRGDKNLPLCSLIVGNPVSDSDSKRYVRIPGQDPVYVVNLDSAVFSTRFQDWIEKDLLQLSSIDISEIAIESYDAALDGRGGSVSLERAFDAELAVVGGSDWELRSLVRYDDQQQPQPSQLAAGESLATAKLNELKNALDDLKIVDVAAKPKGMSENLKADKDLVSDNEAVRSLAVRGFFPLSSGDIISANGQMDVTLNDGVQYNLRFGNIQGLADTPDEAEEDGENVGGANRYLLVTAQVDEAKFPAPELKPIPKTIEELDAMNAAAAEPVGDAMPADETPAAEPPSEEPPAEPMPAAEDPAEDTPAEDKPAEATADQDAAESNEDAPQPADQPAEPNDSAEPAETEEPAADSTDSPAEEVSTEAVEENDENACDVPEAGDSGEEATEPAAETAPDEPASDEDLTTETAESAEPAADAPATEPAAADPTETEPAVEETAEEKQERLEAEQEKITKENQRMLDERKNQLDAAQGRVRELNSRFADWYYVIPESTYRKLRLSLDDIIETADSEESMDLPGESSQAPSFNFPGLAP